MATEAQITANRLNSQKSTGPRSAEGKAAVSQNALKHGLFAHEAVVNGENPADFELYRDAFMADLRPAGAMGSMLAERIVSLSWRLRRTERMQNQAIDEMIEGLKPTRLEFFDRQSVPMFLRDPDKPDPEPRMALGRAAKKDWANSRVLDRLMMYERRIESSLHRAINELHKLKILREVEQADADAEFAGQTRPARSHRGDLKKQSQCVPAPTGTKSCVKKDYGDKTPAGMRKNKPKQTQLERRATGAGAGRVCGRPLAGSA